MTVSWRSGARRVTHGPGRPREIQRDVQVDGGGLRLAGTIVHHQDVVAGLADAEVERAGLADAGDGQHTVGQIFAQTFEIGARHQGQADLAGAGLAHRKLAVTRAGCWRRLTSTYFHSAGGNLVDLVHQFDAGGGGQQEK